MFEGYDLTDKIFVGAMLVLLSIMIIVALGFPFLVKERETELKACFLQEPKTDDCRFMLWKYDVEHRGGKEAVGSNGLIQGVATGIMVSGATRAAMHR